MYKRRLVLTAIATLSACGRTGLLAGSDDSGGGADSAPPTCPECDPHAWCARGEDKVTCTCRDGFAGDGKTCIDVNECTLGTDACDRQHGACANTEGAYACSCGAGWYLALDGRACVDRVVATQLAANGNHFCAVKPDQTVVCWGSNHMGQARAPSGTFLQVAAGYEFSCGIRTDGSIASWGYLYDAAPSAGVFEQVGAGDFFACALRGDGKVICWGDSMDGKTSAPSGKFVQLGVGREHACAVQVGGKVSCWGRNEYGGTKAPPGSFVQVSSGDGGSCGVRKDGTLACWGGIQSDPPPMPPSGVFAEVVALDYGSAYARRADGTVIGWFADEPEAGVTFKRLAASYRSPCGIRTDGAVLCWGPGAKNRPPPGGTFQQVTRRRQERRGGVDCPWCLPRPFLADWRRPPPKGRLVDPGLAAKPLGGRFSLPEIPPSIRLGTR